jgi:hypothetical protein
MAAFKQLRDKVKYGCSTENDEQYEETESRMTVPELNKLHIMETYGSGDTARHFHTGTIWR